MKNTAAAVFFLCTKKKKSLADSEALFIGDLPSEA
jgi:hypothetical protein